MIIPPKNELWNLCLRHAWSANNRRLLAQYLIERQRITKRVTPSGIEMMECFNHCDPSQVKVVIVGKAPYPDKALNMGLAFSVPGATKKLPPALKNIFRALKVDTGIDNKWGDLTKWAYQGVLLLNPVITTEHGYSNSHERKGWEEFTDEVIKRLNDDNRPRVFMLWGSTAQKKESLIKGQNKLILKTSYPGSQTASNGFIWSKHFSKANQFLTERGCLPINWQT